MLIVCLFVGVLWLVCGVQGSRGYYIVWCLHLGPFPVLQRSTETKGCSVFKSIVCHLNEAFRAKKKKNSTWKYHNVLNISSHSGCFRNMLVLLFGLLFFPVYSLTAIYPRVTRASCWGEKAWNWHYIFKCSPDLKGKHSNPLTWCLKNQQHNSFSTPALSLTSYSLHFRRNLLINISLTIISFHLCQKKRVFSSIPL